MTRRSIIFIALGVCILFLLYLNYQQKNTYSWKQHYLQDSLDPYGSLYFSELTDQATGVDSLRILRTPIEESLPAEDVNSNYVFVGEGMNLSSEDLDQLLDFVGNGNTALIASRVLPVEFIDYIYPIPCDSTNWYGFSSTWDTTAQMSLNHPDLLPDSIFQFSFYARDRISYYDWQFFSHQHVCDSLEGFTEIGKLQNGLANFVRIPYGQGYFYLHTNPIAFSNLSLLERQGVTYSELVLTHLQEGPVYWDEQSRISLGVGERLNGNSLFNKNLNNKSPLQFILSEASLAWAWYLLLAMGLLYLIFRAKRRQRVIPILEPNNNTSLQFISTIGRLYFMQSNHKQLALQKMRLLQVFIKEKYNMNTRELDQDLAARLASRSGVGLEHILRIFQMHKNIASGNFVSENTLIDFHKALEKFYHNSK
ncbi:MAG: DUF4350 domain-containing protein [Cyanothece sp. SIO1E1]|nr:DUF4350 domain-containing protein [Cyanothece sp. SIO1E1]